MEFHVGDKVSLIDVTNYWGGYGFNESIITKAWTSIVDNLPRYSIKSSKGHEITVIKENEIKFYER